MSTLGEATVWQASTSGTINFDPIGLKGLQFQFGWTYGGSEVDDPLTGESRPLSWQQKLAGDMSLRWDVPDTTWTLVAGLEEYQSRPSFRLDQVNHEWSAPSVNFFSVENKNVFGAKVRLQLVNTNDTSENSKTTFFTGGRRTNPIDRVEESHRTFGPIVRLNVSGTF